MLEEDYQGIEVPDETHVLDLLPAFVLGSLDANEASQVDQHLLSCLICRKELTAFKTVVEQLSFTASAVAPSLDLKGRLMQQVQAERHPSLERLLLVWSLASFSLMIALAVFNLALWQRLNQSAFITASGGMRAIAISGTDKAPNATGFVIVSRDGDNGALVVDGLPSLDADHQYQLWLVRDGQRTSGAIFSTDEETYGSMRIRAPGSLLQYSAVDITIEPTGGSPQPTGTVVLDGPLLNP